jgi:hypothetical protein
MVRSVIEGGLTKAAAADQFNITPKTVANVIFNRAFPRGRTPTPNTLRDDLLSPSGDFFQRARDEASVKKARRRKRSRAMLRRILSAPVLRC